MFFFAPAASSFFMNRLLGSAAGMAVPINFGPVPSTMGLPPLVLGFPFFGGGVEGGLPFVGAGTPFGGGTGGTGIPGGQPAFSTLGGFQGFA
jgi:hypothetical protein